MNSLQFKSKTLDTLILIDLLNRILYGCKQSITNHSTYLPIFSFYQQLNPTTLQYQLVPNEQFSLTTATLAKFVRIIQLVKICIQNLQHGNTITKRNLFYKLQQYYQNYGTVDKDIKQICQNLYFLYSKLYDSKLVTNIVRNDLGVIASNRCIIFGAVNILIDGRSLSTTYNQVTTLPTCRTIQVKCKAKNIIIIQKQSIFYEIMSIFRQNNLHQQYLLISAKGYPDQITRNLLFQFMQQKQSQAIQIFYLGDFDVFGFDIFLFYAFGDWFCEGLLPKIQIIQLGRAKDTKIFNWRLLKDQMNDINKSDERKIEQIKQKWFKKIISKSDKLQSAIFDKIINIMTYFDEFIGEKKKCELQLFSLYAYNKLWLHQLIKQNIF